MPNQLLLETNKRLMLNLLIQGASSHTILTAHHLVKDDLEELAPGLTALYDRLTVSLGLNQIIGDLALVFGLPSRFWARTDNPGHPFHRCPLLSTHGRDLFLATRQYHVDRARQKSVSVTPVMHTVQMYKLVFEATKAERGREVQLTQIAKKAASQMWNIDEHRLDAQITKNVAFGHLRTPRTRLGKLMRYAVAGYGGVERRNGQFFVVGRAWYFPLVLTELIKGTAELVCLHGLNSLDDETFESVVDDADQIEYELWLMQAGSELWRRLLAVLPSDPGLAEMLMHIARLEPLSLERLMFAVVESPDEARRLLSDMIRRHRESI